MSLSGIPDAPDESCRDRETVRLPRSTSKEIQRLVDEGRYPNRSAAIRAGVRLLIEHESADCEEVSDSDGSAASGGSADSDDTGADDSDTR
jgi:Arc/MetJ-type ribon-helix-helix transcriptional regulator